jgi:hypothetical protein
MVGIVEQIALLGGGPQKALMEPPYKSGAADRKTRHNPLMVYRKSRLNLGQPREEERCCFGKVACTGLSTGYTQKLWTTKFRRIFDKRGAH